MRTDIDRAYLAGLLDGEGHISISLLSTPNGGKRHVLVVGITNTYLPALEELAELWGASVGHIRQRSPQRRRAGEIKWTTAAAATILREVQPFLRIKHAQCAVALAFRELINPLEYKSRTITESDWQAREELRLALGRLNGRVPEMRPPPDVDRPALTCQYCGEQFTAYQKRRKYCSQACNMKAGRDAYEQRTRSITACPLCRTEFLARKGQVYCSIKCGRAVQPAHSTKATGTSWRDKKREREAQERSE